MGGVVRFAVALVAWQAASDARLVDPLFLPSPMQIADALQELAASGDLRATSAPRSCASAPAG